MIDQVVMSRSEMSLIVTFCSRQYKITTVADYHTWFPNLLVEMNATPCEVS